LLIVFSSFSYLFHLWLTLFFFYYLRIRSLDVVHISIDLPFTSFL
jgi:hypothetical protein